jgi:alpha-mannosidase
MTTTRTLAVAATMAALLTVASAGPTGVKKPQQKRDLSKGNTLYAVPYAHLDTQWRWAYPQVIREYIWNTMADNLALIDKYPHYVFNFSGSRRYEMMQEYYPAEYQKVVAAVKAGRWFPCGSSVDEGDANVPSGESIIRHVLYGNNWFRKNLGVASQEFMLPDCFGFPYALPTLLKHCGLEGFSTQKLTWGSPVGIPFKVGNWEGPDGQSIVAALDPGAYTGVVTEDLSENTSWLARITNTGKQSGAYVDYHYYGTGDQGGAPRASSVEWIEKSIAGKGPITVVSGPADDMFKSLTPGQISKLPHYKGELLLTEHSAGSITSQAHMKRWNRKNELLADAAERASVAANLWAQTPYPADRLYTSWDLLLGSQMHDMLPGTSLPKAYEFCYNDELLASNGFSSVERDALGAITNQMDTQSKGTPLVVFNPLSIAREDVVEAWVPRKGPITVFGPDGQPVATQIVGSANGKTQIAFLAKMPANGFASFDARPVAMKIKPTVVASGNTITSPQFVVKIDANGNIASIYDKVNKKESLKAPAGLDFQHHNPAQYPSWNMDWDDAQKGPYAKSDSAATVRIVENGPVRATIEVVRTLQGSKFVQRISLGAGGAGDRVNVWNVIDWTTKETALKAAFPLTTSNPVATYDLQTGAIQRGVNNKSHYEVPQHQWFDQTSKDGKYGVAILNDCKFGSDKPNDDTVRLTLLYTPGTRGGYQDQGTQDFGRHEILYAIAPHAGDWRKGNVAWTAKRLNQPLQAFVAPAHEGRLGKVQSLASASTGQVEIQAIKRAENGNGFVVRLRELTGAPASNVAVKLSNMVVSAQEVDGQERPIGKATVKNGSVIASVRGYGLKSYQVQLATTRIALPQPKSQSVALSYDLDVASTDKNDTDGAFDAQGRSYPAEQLPKSLSIDGVGFKLGSTADGAKNALEAKGQTITLPKGFDRVYILAAATTDVQPTFKVGSKSVAANVGAWDGFVGNWDTRLWSGKPPELAFNWPLTMVGLEPGYMKKVNVAWYASHRHLPGKGNDHYAYTYLFKNSFDVPKGATTLTLPNDPRVRIFAVSVASQTHDSTVEATPLFDTLDGHKEATGKPTILATPDANGDGSKVTLTPPLYWNGGNLRYTLDGSAPTTESPVYKDEIEIFKPTTVTVSQFGTDGSVLSTATAQIEAKDEHRPVVTGTTIFPTLGVAMVSFSEKIDPATITKPDIFVFRSGRKVESATLRPDGKTVDLVLDTTAKPVTNDETMGVGDVKDFAGNPIDYIHQGVGAAEPTFTSPILEPSKTATFDNVAPTEAKAPWTMNLWLLIDQQPADRTLIAGFGRATDGREGASRFFAKFSTGIQFWVTSRDLVTNVPYDTGKWQMLTATYDGATLSLYKNGKLIGSGQRELENDNGRVSVFPVDAWDRQRKVDGEIRSLNIWSQSLPATAVEKLYQNGRG